MAFRWRADDGPELNADLVAVIFQGIRHMQKMVLTEEKIYMLKIIWHFLYLLHAE